MKNKPIVGVFPAAMVFNRIQGAINQAIRVFLYWYDKTVWGMAK